MVGKELNGYCRDSHDNKYYIYLHNIIELVWKVARYTSSCPGVFQPKDGFVDGGVKAMNPSEYALTRIQEYLNEVLCKLYEIGQKVYYNDQHYACFVQKVSLLGTEGCGKG